MKHAHLQKKGAHWDTEQFCLRYPQAQPQRKGCGPIACVTDAHTLFSGLFHSPPSICPPFLWKVGCRRQPPICQQREAVGEGQRGRSE